MTVCTTCLVSKFFFMNVEVEIYMTNITKFFKNNPKDLLSLIPQDKENVFFEKIREKVIDNVGKGNDVTLTKKQLLDICLEINEPQKQVSEISDSIYQETKFGRIYLN